MQKRSCQLPVLYRIESFARIAILLIVIEKFPIHAHDTNHWNLGYVTQFSL